MRFRMTSAQTKQDYQGAGSGGSAGHATHPPDAPLEPAPDTQPAAPTAGGPDVTPVLSSQAETAAAEELRQPQQAVKEAELVPGGPAVRLGPWDAKLTDSGLTVQIAAGEADMRADSVATELRLGADSLLITMTRTTQEPAASADRVEAVSEPAAA